MWPHELRGEVFGTRVLTRVVCRLKLRAMESRVQRVGLALPTSAIDTVEYVQSRSLHIKRNS